MIERRSPHIQTKRFYSFCSDATTENALSTSLRTAQLLSAWPQVRVLPGAQGQALPLGGPFCWSGAVCLAGAATPDGPRGVREGPAVSGCRRGSTGGHGEYVGKFLAPSGRSGGRRSPGIRNRVGRQTGRAGGSRGSGSTGPPRSHVRAGRGALPVFARVSSVWHEPPKNLWRKLAIGFQLGGRGTCPCDSGPYRVRREAGSEQGDPRKSTAHPFSP
jgi:hypothetical protein